MQRVACCDIFIFMIMKRVFLMLGVGAMMLGLACACSSGSKEPSALISQSERIDQDLSQLAEDSPMFLADATASYADGTLSINLEFCDSIVHADQLSDVLIRYVLGQYMKAHTGENLDITLNTLGKEEGVLSLTIKDIYGQTKVLDLPSATVKKLVTTKQMELGYQDARVNVLDIMDTRCDRYKTAVNALSCEFKYNAGFAQYTLTFKNANAFANQTQGSLAGRYIAVLKPVYDDFGACRPMVEELLSSLQIEGYRFVYKDADDSKELHTALPWRMLN